jgi:hypothetical protein
MADLHIRLGLRLSQPGPDRRWGHEVTIPVPPDYNERDLLPFVRHQLESAVTALEDADLGGARAAEIIAAYDLRARAIAFLLRTAGPRERNTPVAAAIRAVLEADNETIFALWANGQTGD